MIRLKFRVPDSDRTRTHSADIARILMACREAGFEVSDNDIAHAWDAFSDTQDAGWLILNHYTDEELVWIMQHYCEEVE